MSSLALSSAQSLNSLPGNPARRRRCSVTSSVTGSSSTSSVRTSSSSTMTVGTSFHVLRPLATFPPVRAWQAWQAQRAADWQAARRRAASAPRFAAPAACPFAVETKLRQPPPQPEEGRLLRWAVTAPASRPPPPLPRGRDGPPHAAPCAARSTAESAAPRALVRHARARGRRCAPPSFADASRPCSPEVESAMNDWKAALAAAAYPV